MKLQRLVGIVDTKLFEAVGGKILKTKDVQDAHEGEGLFVANGLVDLLQDPGEHSSVKG